MPRFAFLALLAVIVICVGVVLHAASLWCVGRVMKVKPLPFGRIAKFTTLYFLFGLAVSLGLRALGIDITDAKQWIAAILVFCMFVACRIWITRRILNRNWLPTCLAALGVVVIEYGMLFIAPMPLRSRLLDYFVVPTPSMAPTIQPNARIIIDRTSAPTRWDMVVYKAPGEPSLNLVKRVVGLPGERVEILRNSIRINGTELALPPVLRGADFHSMSDLRGGELVLPVNSPIVLEADEYYVIGDNLKFSSDSRNCPPPADPRRQKGPVLASDIHGVVRVIYNRTSLWPDFPSAPAR